MQLKFIIRYLFLVYLPVFFVQSLSAQTITSNQSGTLGGYCYEYVGNKADASMVLGDGGDFSCTWSNLGDFIQFAKGKKPGSKTQVISYSASCNSNGVSYMGIYGLTKNPSVEFFIIDNWSVIRPTAQTFKGTIVSDSGVYDLYVKAPGSSLGVVAEPAQFVSVRQAKRTNGTISCANHFEAWALNNMLMGELIEVVFCVYAYQSNGSADIKMLMTSGNTAITALQISQSKTAQPGLYGITSNVVKAGGQQTLKFNMPQNCFVSSNVYNLIGQEIFRISGNKYSAGKYKDFVNYNSSGKFLYKITIDK
jgi:hypothetical protein